MQARAGVWPGVTQASHTSFISPTVRMSESQIVAVRSFDLSVPAFARKPSIRERISRVWAASRMLVGISGVISGKLKVPDQAARSIC